MLRIKKRIWLGLLLIVFALFLSCQFWWQSAFRGNLILELGTHIDVLDSMKIEFYVDDKLTLDTIIYKTAEILTPIDLPRKKHTAFFIVNGNKSEVFTFNNYLFTFIVVEYSERIFFTDNTHFINIRVRKHPLRFVA